MGRKQQAGCALISLELKAPQADSKAGSQLVGMQTDKCTVVPARMSQACRRDGGKAGTRVETLAGDLGKRRLDKEKLE